MDQTPEKPKKKRLNSKGKGSGFEGLVANKLSAALTPLKFIRTQGSGARVGGKNFETLGQMFGEDALKLFVGDVVPVNEKNAGIVFRHSIECKSYKTPDNFTAMVNGTGNVFKWMKEAEEDAVKTKRNPLLIFKWNNTPIFVAMSAQLRHPVRITLIQGGKTIYVAYLDDLLKYPAFWYDSIEKEAPNADNTNRTN